MTLNDRPNEVSHERALGIARENSEVAVGKFAEEEKQPEDAEAGMMNQGMINSGGVLKIGAGGVSCGMET